MHIAIFVDAGYLYAQGSALISGHVLRREAIRLDVGAVQRRLTELAAETGLRPFRIFWYDARPENGSLTQDQEDVRKAGGFTLRLGNMVYGRQKGVDSQIVIDLVKWAEIAEWAGGDAVGGALVLAGDADIAPGIEALRDRRVEIHLLGIEPAGGSLSRHLTDAAASVREWDAGVVGELMETGKRYGPRDAARTDGRTDGRADGRTGSGSLADVLSAIIGRQRPSAIERFADKMERYPDRSVEENIPFLTASLRKGLRRSLTDSERDEFNRICPGLIRARHSEILQEDEDPEAPGRYG